MAVEVNDQNEIRTKLSPFTREYWLPATVIAGAIPCWLVLIKLSKESDVAIWARMLSIFVGVFEGVILVALFLQISTRAGRTAIDRFLANISSHPTETNVTFFSILVGFCANPFLMGFFIDEESSLLLRLNVACALAVPAKTFASYWVDSWGKKRKK